MVKITVYKIIAFFSLIIIGFLLTKDIPNPYYSYIGDDISFYINAKQIADTNFQDVNIFSQKGVYGYHPVLDSVYQAIFMKMFGYMFGWKFSVIFVYLISGIFVWLIGKQLGGEKTGTIALIFYIFSHYLIGYSHIGYNNMNSLFSFLASIYFFIRATKYKKTSDYLFAGLFTGFSFYTFYSARVVLFVLSPFLVNLLIKNKKHFKYFALGFFLLFIPFYMINGDEILRQSMLKALADPDYHKPAFIGVGMYFLGLVIPQYIGTHHFTIGPLISPVLFFSFVGGLIYLIKIKRIFDYEFLLVLFWFLFCSVFIVATFFKDDVPTTRLMVTMPSIALIGGYVVSKIKNNLLIGIILMLHVVLELYTFYIIMPEKFSPTTNSKILLFAKEHKNNLICVNNNDLYFGNQDLGILKDMYGLSNIAQVSPSNMQKLCNSLVSLPADPNTGENSFVIGIKTR